MHYQPTKPCSQLLQGTPLFGEDEVVSLYEDMTVQEKPEDEKEEVRTEI